MLEQLFHQQAFLFKKWHLFVEETEGKLIVPKQFNYSTTQKSLP